MSESSERVDMESLPLSWRVIQHIVPVGDGFDHEMVDCTCHPTITAAADFMNAMGVAEMGVQGGEPGQLIFSHNKLGPASRYQIGYESGEDE